MPLIKTTKGYKWGRNGKEFTGRGARAKALRQGRAIEASKRRNNSQ